MKRFWSKRASFWSATQGNMAITLALAIIPLVAAVGGGIDYSRYVSARTDLQSTLDAAVLAGTQAYAENGQNAAAAVAVANKYYTTQMQQANYQLTTNTVTFVVNSTNTGLAASGDVRMQTSFLNVIGINTLPLLTTAVAEASVAEAGHAGTGNNLEVSLMLDVTGSMCDDGSGPCTTGTKISGLKSAAAALIDKVVWADQSTYQSRVALVPFNTMVRLEPDAQANNMMKAITNMDPTWNGYYQTCIASTGSNSSTSSETNATGNWTCTQTQNLPAVAFKLRPCVTDRYYDASSTFDLTDDAPGGNKWLNATSGSRMPLSYDSSDTAPTSGVGNTITDPINGWNYSPTGTCDETSNANQVVPLTSNVATLKNAISGLEAYSGTAGVLGTAFSWYMLSPNWGNVWTGQSKPGSYADLTTKNSNGQPTLRKVAVLMTDGAYNAYRGWKGADMATISNNAVAMCAAMKAKGIEVFTVGFDLGSLTPTEQGFARTTLQNCGTDVSHFYDSLDSSQLVAAFNDIGQKIAATSTRLTK